MKPIDPSGRCGPLPHWGLFAATALIAAVLAGCSGDDGAPGATGATGAPGATGATGATGPAGQDANAPVFSANTSPATTAQASAWAALAPQISNVAVAPIASPVQVTFTVKDAAGNPVSGLTSQTQATTATVPSYTNIAFTLAKLVPGTINTVSNTPAEPSKWVSLNVVRRPTKAETTLPAGVTDYTKIIPATSSCNATPTTAATWCGTFPATDAQGKLTEDPSHPGNYTYTFDRDIKNIASIVAGLTDSADGLAKKADLGSPTDLAYDPAATYRLGIQIGGNAPGTGSNYVPDPTTMAPCSGAGCPVAVPMGTPANAVYDFRPDGGTLSTRSIVAMASCNDCHAAKVLAHGSRKDPNYCVTCHTDQIRYSFSQEASTQAGSFGLILNGTTRQTTAVVNNRALGDLPNMLHHIHMGEELVKTGYNFNNSAEGKFNEVLYPQPRTNCVKCHDGDSTDPAKKTANGNNWNGNPSMLACGACHDGINFKDGTGATLQDKATDLAAGNPIGTTQTGHVGGSQADNSKCAWCHVPSDIKSVYHVTVDPTGSVDRGGYPVNTAQDVPTPGWPAGQGPAIPLASQLGNLPAGVYKIGLELKSVTLSGGAGANKATVVYRVLKDGVPVTLNAAGSKYLIDGIDGSPSIYIVYGVLQDGMVAGNNTAVDWNKNFNASIKDIRDGKNGSQTGPDDPTTGWYTAKLSTVIPDNATMITAGFGINYQGFVQLDNAKYPKGIRLREPAFVIMTASGKNGAGATNAARRAVVSNAKCDNCHGQLGVSPSFHSGARNNGEGCSFCHLPDTATGHVGAPDYGGGWSVQAKNLIHGIHGASKRTQAFTYEATAANPLGFEDVGYPGVLSKCEQCHVTGSYDFSAAANSAAVPNLLWTTDASGNMTQPPGVTPIGQSPWVTTLGGGPADFRTTNLPVGNLVSSPLAAACFGCHDSSQAVAHMQLNGGTLVTPVAKVSVSGTSDRSMGFKQVETCTVCHAPGKVADIKVVHQ